MRRVKISEPRLNRTVTSKADAAGKIANRLDATASIRKGIAQARRGEGRLADDALDELERQA